ncbi:MAG: glycosyltransferase [Verrucomicrobia bacterium]|nr:glycosyltransferase [Verrucomicrobiota bacterium]
MPSFNQAAFLPAALSSVFAQRADLDFAVHDGGSTDGSVDILRRAAEDGRAFRWHSGPDHGQADAINSGLSRATGQIHAFLNSDDLYYPEALERVAAHFRTHPECQVVFGNADHLDARGKVIAPYPTEDWSYERLQVVCFLCQPAVFWRREVTERYGLLDATLQYALDYEYWLRLGREIEFVRLPGKPLAGSRLHPAAKTLRARVDVHRESLQVVRRHGGSASAQVKWLRALADAQLEARATLPSYWRWRALLHAAFLLEGAVRYRVRPGPELWRELRRALGGKPRWESFRAGGPRDTSAPDQHLQPHA